MTVFFLYENAVLVHINNMKNKDFEYLKTSSERESVVNSFSKREERK